jgi:hypothetical protein
VILLGKNTTILWGAFDLSAYANKYSADNGTGTIETPTFGSTYNSRIASENDAKYSVSGLWDGTATSGPDVRADAQTDGSQFVATTILGTAMGITGRASVYLLRQAAYKSEAAKGGAVTFQVDGQIDGYGASGFPLHNSAETSLTGPLTGTGVSFGGPGDANTISRYVANLHVTALTGTSPNITVKLQTATTVGGVYTDLVSFTAFTGTTAEQKTGTPSAVGPFVRYVATLNSGSLTSVTFALAFARLG